MTATAVRTDAQLDAFAAALSAALPFTGRLRAPKGAMPRTGDVMVSASFIGDRTAELGVVLTDTTVLAGAADGGIVAPADVLRPALVAASAELGVGILSELIDGLEPSLLDDPATALWEIVAGTRVIGAVAVRVRSDEPRRVVTDLTSRMGRLNSVEMELTVEIGRTRMTVRDLLALEIGAIVELDRSVGSPADVLLNGRRIAHGEVVVVDQEYAVRITRILDAPEEKR